MRYFLSLFLLCLMACQSGNQQAPPNQTGNESITDTVKARTVLPKANAVDQRNAVFGNQRFKEVRVEKTDATHYRVTGKGQLFEAALSWVVEEGHNELVSGHQTTTAGAPEWGAFDFTFELVRKANTTPHLILLEYSAKDGSRQHELPIPLPD